MADLVGGRQWQDVLDSAADLVRGRGAKQLYMKLVAARSHRTAPPGSRGPHKVQGLGSHPDSPPSPSGKAMPVRLLLEQLCGGNLRKAEQVNFYN